LGLGVSVIDGCVCLQMAGLPSRAVWTFGWTNLLRFRER
jgi:hypothetical protein